MTNKQLKDENADLKKELKAAQGLLDTYHQNPPPKHLACGLQVEKGQRVYGTKEAIYCVQSLVEQVDRMTPGPVSPDDNEKPSFTFGKPDAISNGPGPNDKCSQEGNMGQSDH